MSTALSNATQRAIRRIVGPDTFEILIEAVVDQVYKLSLNLPVGYKVTAAAAKTDSGTCTIDVQTVTPGGVAADITGLAGIAASAVIANAVPTFDGTEVVAAGGGLQLDISGNAAGVNLSVSITAQRITGGE